MPLFDTPCSRPVCVPATAQITAFTALPDDTIKRDLWLPTLARTAMQLHEDIQNGGG